MGEYRYAADNFSVIMIKNRTAEGCRSAWNSCLFHIVTIRLNGPGPCAIIWHIETAFMPIKDVDAMSRIKMTVIAPYEGLKGLVLTLSGQYPQFDIQVVVANLWQGVQAAEALHVSGADIILSRGGTAELIERHVSVPVISIDISGYDYIRMITLASGFSGKSAMVGFRSITEGAQSIKKLMDNPIDIFTIADSEELSALLDRLKRENYQVILGDVVTSEEAHKMGFTSVLLTSGEESVRKAFSEAERVYRYLQKVRLDNILEKQVLANVPMYYAVLDRDGGALFQKLPADQSDAILKRLADEAGNVFQNESKRQSLFQLDDKVWSISENQIRDGNGRTYAAFYLSLCPVEMKTVPGLAISSPKTPSDFSISTFGRNSNYLKGTYEKVKEYTGLHVPVLIVGEIGTGKDALAELIRFVGAEASPFLTLDGETANSASLMNFQKILRTNDSAAVYLRQPCLLSLDNQRLLLSILSDPGFFERHLVVSSFCELPESLVSSDRLLEALGRLLGKYRIRLPSLRERPGDMRDLVSNYMNEANFQFGKQVVAIEDEALRLLVKFNWTTNLEQLRRVTDQLVLLADEPTIRSGVVARVLGEESDLNQPREDIPIAGKSLDDLVDEIIQRVIREEKGNMARVSSRLGISRSTVWRHMKKQK